MSAGRTRRPWLGRRGARAGARRSRRYDPDCYLCPGNTRANGDVNPDYAETFVFTNDFAALRPDTSIAAFDDGLLRAEGERGTCRVVCFSPRHDLTLGRDGARGRPARRRRVGRADRRARRRLPLGPGLREPRRGDGRLEPASARPDLGRHGAARARPPARTRRSAPIWRRPAGGCCSTTSTRSRAGRGSSSRPTSGWWSCRSGRPGRSRRCSCRSGRRRA